MGLEGEAKAGRRRVICIGKAGSKVLLYVQYQTDTGEFSGEGYPDLLLRIPKTCIGMNLYCSINIKNNIPYFWNTQQCSSSNSQIPPISCLASENEN